MDAYFPFPDTKSGMSDEQMAAILLRPGKIGNLTVKNRFVMTPVDLEYLDSDGEMNSRMIEFYRQRAAGGVGLIVVGVVGVDPTRISAGGSLRLCRDSDIPGMRKLAEAIHEGGAKVFAQLWHPGAYALPDQFPGQTPVAPSSYFCRFSHSQTKELTAEEIGEIVGYFGQAAFRAREAGYDGVEIIGSAGYLISQFLSASTNHRADRYGGDLYQRMTFLREVTAAVREAVGEDYPVALRLAGNEFVPDGNDNDDCVKIAVEAEAMGINALNITGGWHETRIPQVTMDVPRGAYTYLARRVKEQVSIPVYACNRLDIPTAAAVVGRGDADFVGLCRAFIADPELVNKLAAGQSGLVRPCLGCNQGCMDHIFKGIPLTCLSNEYAGFEEEQAGTPARRILVVGAGVAGMEYALRTAKSASVTVWEKRDMPGGQMELVSSPPGREDFMRLPVYQYRACTAAGVTFEFGHAATADEIIRAYEDGRFDQVVIATGAGPILPDFPTEEGADVVSAWDVLRGRALTGRNVVVIGGGAVGMETALKLAEEGTLSAETLKFLFLYQAEKPERLHELLTRGSKSVHIVEMREKMGLDVGSSTKWILMGNLKRYHVVPHTDSKVVSISKEGVTVEHSDQTREVIGADTVVVAVGSLPENSLAEELQEFIPGLVRIGDAVSPRKALDALADVREALGDGVKED